MNYTYVTVDAVIRSLINMLDEGTIHLKDKIIFAGVIKKCPKEEELNENGITFRGPAGYPDGTLNLLIRLSYPRETEDADIYIFMKDNKEDTKE